MKEKRELRVHGIWLEYRNTDILINGKWKPINQVVDPGTYAVRIDGFLTAEREYFKG